MWEKLRAIFTIPELRQKIFFTLLLLAVFRIGYQIPLPIIDQQQLAKNMQESEGGSTFRFIEHVSIFSAADLRRITIFGLGIMPYISASIILQLLGSVYKPLEELRKEGETGRKKINEYTRYLTVLMCLVQGAIYLGSMLGNTGDAQASSVAPEFAVKSGALHPAWYFTVILMMTCGTMFVMWLGEQIDEFGIGNGISLLIMAGILAQMPNAMIGFFQNWRPYLTGFREVGVEHVIVLIVLFVVVVFGVVFMQLGHSPSPGSSWGWSCGRIRWASWPWGCWRPCSAAAPSVPCRAAFPCACGTDCSGRTCWYSCSCCSAASTFRWRCCRAGCRG
jgi:preprotein translocase subunit SecY